MGAVASYLEAAAASLETATHWQLAHRGADGLAGAEYDKILDYYLTFSPDGVLEFLARSAEALVTVMSSGRSLCRTSRLSMAAVASAAVGGAPTTTNTDRIAVAIPPTMLNSFHRMPNPIV